MILKKLLEGIYDDSIPIEVGMLDIKSIATDSRKADKGSIFIAVPGTKEHGGRYIKDAIVRGARVIIKDHATEFSTANLRIMVLSVDDTRTLLIPLLTQLYGHELKKIRTIGITGTNGKTTISYLVESIFHSVRKPIGVIGTVNYRYAQKILPANNTTPGIADMYALLAAMVQDNVLHCVLEVSSHALAQGRVAGINFHTAVFTNLTSDHLDYHKSQEEYFQAKTVLFRNLNEEAMAVLNHDDPSTGRLKGMTRAIVKTYGIKNKSDFMAKDIRLKIDGTEFRLVTPEGDVDVESKLIGEHNIYNILAAAAVCADEHMELSEIAEGISRLLFVPGRLEHIQYGQDYHLFVDYAHTEDALYHVLTSLRRICTARIILVFGCGGDRDKTKRPKMGRVASQLADLVIITNDNPRSEDPQTIAQEIAAGFEKDNYTIMLDRKEAIFEVLEVADKGDVVLIAGKGHEDYQIFKDQTVPFNEREILRDYLRKKHSLSPDLDQRR